MLRKTGQYHGGVGREAEQQSSDPTPCTQANWPILRYFKPWLYYASSLARVKCRGRAQTFYANRILETVTRFKVQPVELSITCTKRLCTHPRGLTRASQLATCKREFNDALSTQNLIYRNMRWIDGWQVSRKVWKNVVMTYFNRIRIERPRKT
jgi:hypothetical protein